MGNRDAASASRRVGEHVRSNVVGYVALFVALGGTAAALPGRNTVDSRDIKNAQVKLADIAPDSVDGARIVDGSVSGADIGGGAVASGEIADGSVTGADVLDGTLGAQDVGGDSLGGGVVNESELLAGGALTGTLGSAGIAAGAIGPNEIANGAVSGGTGGDIADGSITNADVTTNAANDLTGQNIDEATLSGVNAAKLGGVQVQNLAQASSEYGAGMVYTQVDTATAAAGTELIDDDGRWRLETGTAQHTFRLCGESVSVPQPYLLLTEADNWIGTPGTVPSGSCTANLATGGVSNTSAGAMVIFAPDAVVLIGPSTLNFATADPRRYQITVLSSGGIQSCADPDSNFC